MKLLGINNLKKQKGIGKKSIKSKSNTKSKLSKKGGANYTITKLSNNGRIDSMSNQCFWISLSQGINIIKGNNDITVTFLRDMVKDAGHKINESTEQFDTHKHIGAYNYIHHLLSSFYRINLHIISSSYPEHVTHLINTEMIKIKNENLIIYHTPGHFELVTQITNETGKDEYTINNYVKNSLGEHTNDFVYNKDGDVVKLDEINTETEINKLLDAINSMKDVDKKHWEGILNKKLESISPSVSSTEKKAENKAAQQAEKGKTEKEKTEKEKRMKEEINQADFTKLLEIYNKLKGEVEKKLNEIKPSNNSS